MKNLKTQGFILIDVDVVALNNAGKSTSTEAENGVATKRIQKNGRSYTYVSGQAWRYWWRNALQKDFNWGLSPIIREAKVAFTAANPIQFADDDVFGYMKAATEVVTDEKGKDKKENITVTRVSPLKNSAIVSVTSVQVVENWSSMSRHEGDAVPYTKQEYSAIMKGMFSLDLEAVGTFAAYNKTGFKNLSAKLREEALAQTGSSEISDPHLPSAKGEAHQLVRLDKSIRTQRISETLSALKFLSGGAMQTNNMADVAPTFVILATTTSGNHPFSHVATSKGSIDQTFELNVDGIEEILRDFKAQIQGKVFIGHRSGFLSSADVQKLEVLKSQYPGVVELGSINDMIDKYVAQVEKQIP
ncbi:type I-B CRISPR-associated protein Cas7/Cst2/DevR [Haliscomenobacter hydrossis]|uniref:CRISPR-associated autoregulator, DevR family n=1 Tax=Haliscomenobacter hydrossis (strain ATCC 27775 / DSM 1100 / LMG 10767 / O) TaxID=760192 RepID=F4KYC2_HALH1|nr:type I-B CRISPR-associated protein Cas7/Cst2/DevR [Haliscomenobacter hydrossis]AEE48385.1 CRISPR-associated autoregulator, DevR family [Haliscomenobacter hydrossis DSM 1100]